jgi:hypothetical protein
VALHSAAAAAQRRDSAVLSSANKKDDQGYDKDRSKDAATNIHKILQCMPRKLI